MDKKFDIKSQNATFHDDPLEYCRGIYEEARRRNDDLKDINVENRLFYEGTDETLKERERDDTIQRSALFIHQLKPAIDTRVSDSVTAIEEREYPITVRPDTDMPTDDDRAQAGWIERELNQQLRACGYLNDGFREHILASEMYRTPAFVKVGWEDVYEKEATVVEPSSFSVWLAGYLGRATPSTEVRWVNRYHGGRPFVEFIPPDQLLYQPNVSNFYDSDYVIHADWVTWNRLMALAEEYGWDKKKINKYRAEIEAGDEDGKSNDSHGDEVEAGKDTPYDVGYKDGKILVCENYVCYYTETGEEIVEQVVTVGLKHIVKQRRAPDKGLKYPFVPLVANPMPGTIEGLSSVDVGKTLQRLYNEVFNTYLDAISYKLFPPLLREPGTTIQGKPTWGLGRIWDVTNPEGLRPLIENFGTLPDLPSLMEAVAAKLRDTLNAQDIAQGFQAKEYEKATSTKLRAFGASKRSMPVRKRHGLALVKVAEMILALNQQHHPEKERFVMRVILDAPSLTNISDPETDKRDSILLLGQAMELPFYQTPLGQVKLLHIWRQVLSKFVKIDVNEYTHSKEELREELLQMRGLEDAAQEQMAAQEGMGIASQERAEATAEEQAVTDAIVKGAKDETKVQN